MLDKLKLEDIPEQFRDLAEVIGLDAYRKLIRYAGGMSIYIPVEYRVTRNVRDRILRETFSGDYKSFSKAYRISEGHLRRIIMKKILKGRSKEVKITAPIGSAEYGRLVKELYSDVVSETKVLDDDLYESICRYDEIVADISRLKLEKDKIEHTLMGVMKESETAFVKERKVTWKKSSRSSFDSKRLREEDPELYERYCRVVSSRLFKIK
ncbi:Mor transcription activator family protein [Romboutsia sp. 1001713B170207_170306_H8]|uniref:Mor transcription activator family protein n=2 Tax=unclassified Romboutsia TaxID=2626894 RepID=UPI00189A43CD|nr:Mor transcription activator family protein [Romboutsia sp. 1001713B170207_170306_H8]